MTDNEIIKAFDNLLNRKWIIAESNGRFITLGDVADLINRQKAENERLKSWVLTFTNGVVIDGSGYYIKELSYDVITNRAKKCKAEIKAEAIKEFAERLCEGRVSNDPVVITVKCELKEKVGDNDE